MDCQEQSTSFSSFLFNAPQSHSAFNPAPCCDNQTPWATLAGLQLRQCNRSRSIGCQATISSSHRTRCLKIVDVTSLLAEPGTIQLPWVFSLHGCCLNFGSITRSKKRSNCNRIVIWLVCKRTPANFHEFTAVSNVGNGEIGRTLWRTGSGQRRRDYYPSSCSDHRSFWPSRNFPPGFNVSLFRGFMVEQRDLQARIVLSLEF